MQSPIVRSNLSLSRQNRAGDLHRCQHEASGRVDHKIDRHILWGILDRRNYCLCNALTEETVKDVQTNAGAVGILFEPPAS